MAVVRRWLATFTIGNMATVTYSQPNLGFNRTLLHLIAEDGMKALLKNILLFSRLYRSPRPLIDDHHRTVISWSAKAACTRVLIWHYERLGLIDEALQYHHWPHKYRMNVLYKSRRYVEGRKKLIREGPPLWDYVKVVRDPVKRCVSSYRHALAHGYADKNMSAVLGKKIDHKYGFSYATFLEYLKGINISRCDVHHQLQAHPLDKIKFGRTWLVHIDEYDLDTELASIDSAQGVMLNRKDSVAGDFVRKDAHRYAIGKRKSDSFDVDQWLRPLRKSDTASWPKQALEKAPEAREIVGKLYGHDYRTISELKNRSERFEAD
ncbi:sulfotransferase family 2 domain-containing protein [Wenzhouxiangella limi]|uniref:Sulfotransferase family protein n=1 Tax=Wenzhouxiangella limi TaxID=2707351 RepID=A0A845V7Y4_9GAMM|nr:sulfotransferase family 2 domain-containing protein [Wenzhouxiangella limi]NDY96291.1 sulfotransferase family protein [Wenzhouxiangella limi]